MKSYLATGEFWTGAAERASRAFAAALIAALGVPVAGPAIGVDVLHVGWLDALSFAAGAALLSLLFSLVAGRAPTGPVGSPSLVDDRPAPGVVSE